MIKFARRTLEMTGAVGLEKELSLNTEWREMVRQPEDLQTGVLSGSPLMHVDPLPSYHITPWKCFLPLPW